MEGVKNTGPTSNGAGGFKLVEGVRGLWTKSTSFGGSSSHRLSNIGMVGAFFLLVGSYVCKKSTYTKAEKTAQVMWYSGVALFFLSLVKRLV